MNNGQAALVLKNISHIYQQGGRDIQVLDRATLSLAAGETVGLTSPSGAGKSTLLHLAGLLARPQSGEIFLAGTEIGHADDRRRTALRCAHIGFVHQFHNLLSEFTALENVMLAMQIAGQSKKQAQAAAGALLAQLGLEDRAGHLPSELSGGEQQRVAIARALANRPAVILADEPTGSLDPRTGERVFDMLMTAVKEQGVAALIATHNMALAAQMGRIVRLDNGQLIEA